MNANLRIITDRTGEFKVGDTLTVTSGGCRLKYELTLVGLDYLDAEYVKPEPKAIKPQKYYSKFRKGWNR